MGSWITYGLGSENQDLPGFVVLISGGSDPVIMSSAVEQYKSLKKQIIDLGNTQLGDQYIFGGSCWLRIRL